MLEADLANKQILMHLYQARYQERDSKDPSNLRKIRDGINMVEGTLPISLDELYEKEKKRPSRSALSIEQLLDQLKSENQRERSASRTEINKRFSFPFACVAFAIIGVPLGVTAHRHGFDCCHHLFSLCHHWRYVARQPASASRAACLVSQCSLYRTGRVFIPAIGPAIDHLSSSTKITAVFVRNCAPSNRSRVQQ